MKKSNKRHLYIAILFVVFILIVFLYSYLKNSYNISNDRIQSDSCNNGIIEKIQYSFYNNIMAKNRYNIIIKGLKNTIFISLLSILFGSILGIIICFMNLSKNILVKGFARCYIRFFRGIPIVLLLLLTYYVVLASTRITPVTVSIIVFSFYFGGYASEIFRSGIKAVSKEQIEASMAIGFTKVQTLLYIILPQALRVIFPVYKGEFITIIKLTSVVGYIGVQDLTRATDIIRSQTFDAFFPLILTTILYFIVIGIFIIILNFIEKIINPKIGKAKIL